MDRDYVRLSREDTGPRVSDIYTAPEAYGLEFVGQVDLDNEPYQFDLLAVWRDCETGEYLYAFDAGCSCPSPFEDTAVVDMTRVRSAYDVAVVIKETVWARGTGDQAGAIELIRRLLELSR